MVSITGTNSADTITPGFVSTGVSGGIPTDVSDLILGGGGADTLDGGGGSDDLKGQGGADTLLGGLGNDTLAGNGGGDRLMGGDGNDKLSGHNGNDWLIGGAGRDVLIGDASPSTATYQAGSDRLDGGDGNDRLIGNGGADTYLGGAGRDLMIIEDGDFARIAGGDDTDTLRVLKRGVDLDLTTLNPKIDSVEILDLRRGDHVVTVDEQSVIGTADGDRLKVTGGDSDTVILTSEFLHTATVTQGAKTFDVYATPRARLLVELDITVVQRDAIRPSLDLADLDGTNGFAVRGTSPHDLLGGAVGAAGDFNDDGFDDIIVGARGAYRSAATGLGPTGASAVIFGSAAGFPEMITLADLNGTNGLVISHFGSSGATGKSVAGAGDTNGDGIDDVIIGAPYAAPGGITHAGGAYVVFGAAGGLAAALDLDSLDGANGFALNGVAVFDQSGGAISGAGDVNGDGFGDVIVGATMANAAYVVFGASGGFGPVVALGALDGSDGFTINGESVGRAVSAAGDVNGDGIDDVIAGAGLADSGGNTDAGRSYVVFGRSGGFAATVDVSDLDGLNGFAINGIDANDMAGISVSTAGDVNGDGIGDLIIGAIDADPQGIQSAGESYVVFGSTGGFTAELDLAALDGANGFVINGIESNDRSGICVSTAGDVNNDGFDDLLVGAYFADPNGADSAGETYLVFGGSHFGAAFDLADLDGANGVVLNGVNPYDKSGRQLRAAGDVNNDGYDDLIIGAEEADPLGQYAGGEAYVVFGGPDFGLGGALHFDSDPPLLG